MKKYIALSLWILFLLTLWWCSKKTIKTIVFETYILPLETKYQYEEIQWEQLENPIMKQYLQKTETGFVWSIIIAKNKAQSWLALSNFATINSKSITRKVNWSEENTTKKVKIKCNETKIEGILQTFEIKAEEVNQYLNQIVFSTGNYLYMISTMTEDKKESKNLAESLKNISCLIQ